MNNDPAERKPEDEEEDDDFPEYANEQNKELNEIVTSNPHQSFLRSKRSVV